MRTHMNNSLYCALASNSISFGSNGHSRPCCAINTHKWNYTHKLTYKAGNLESWFNNPSMVDVRNKLNQGEWHPSCSMCKIREQAGQPSTREIFNHTLSEIEEKTKRSWKTTDSVIENFDNIFLLDITVGNKCNSSCLMCNPSASDMWMKEQEEILGEKLSWTSNNWFNQENASALIEKLPNLKAIQFVGGEPTVNKDHIVMLEKLVESGRSKDITLGYVVNLTAISPSLIELWDKFSTKHITVSIDGLGPVNEYIRYPFSWDKVIRGFDRIKAQAALKKDYHIGLSHTVIPLNILFLDNMLDWWEEQSANHDRILDSIPHVQCVDNPTYFDPQYMPQDMKSECAKTLSRLAKKMQDRGIAGKYDSVIENITVNILQKSPPEDERLREWKSMQEFCAKLDVHRDRKIFDYLPNMKKYWIDPDQDQIRII